LPGAGESPVAPVYIRGEKVASLKGPDMAAKFHAMIEEFVRKTYGTPAS
ncbi:4-hydroxy-3-methylbut-2-en-1-yl diphosphate synthase, partial [gut metagenome]